MPPGQSPPAPVDPLTQEAQALHRELARAMDAYRDLLDEADRNPMDDAAFRMRALRIGLIVRERDAWIMDLPSRRWFRYDGVSLAPLGEEDTPADPASGASGQGDQR